MYILSQIHRLCTYTGDLTVLKLFDTVSVKLALQKVLKIMLVFKCFRIKYKFTHPVFKISSPKMI